MQETTTLNALVMRRARDLIADYGWPDHTDVEQCAPHKPGWISIYVRLDAVDIVHLLPLLCVGGVPAALQRAMTKITGTQAQIILSGSRYADDPQLPEDGTRITFPWAGEWLTEPEIQAVTDCLSRAVRDISRQVREDARRIPEGTAQQVPANVNTAAPETQRVMFFKNQVEEKCRLRRCVFIRLRSVGAMHRALYRCLPVSAP